MHAPPIKEIIAGHYRLYQMFALFSILWKYGFLNCERYIIRLIHVYPSLVMYSVSTASKTLDLK